MLRLLAEERETCDARPRRVSTVSILERAAFDAELGAAALRVLVAIHAHYNRQDREAYPSQETLARKLAISQGSVSKAVGKLVERGYLLAEKRGPKSMLYRLPDAPIAVAAPAPEPPPEPEEVIPSVHKEGTELCGERIPVIPSPHNKLFPERIQNLRTSNPRTQPKPPANAGGARKGRKTATDRERGPDLGPLVDAFRAVGLPDPKFIGGEASAAQRLLKHYSPELLAACWQDIASGEYGDDFMRRSLSFVFLQGSNRVGNWETWKSRANGHRNVGFTYGRSQKFAVEPSLIDAARRRDITPRGDR